MHHAETKGGFVYRGSYLKLVRPLTLTGTISPALAGAAFAAERGAGQFGLLAVFLTAALCVQMAANILNDYFDFRKGQDSDKWTAAERAGGPALHMLPAAAGLLLVLAAILGLWLAFRSSTWVFVFGAISVAGGIFYSAGRRPLSAVGLGEVTAAVLLGLAVFVLSAAVQELPPAAGVFAAALPFVPLIAAMILTNNIRDMKKDKGFRCTLPMLLGRRRAVRLLRFLLVFPYLWTGLLVLSGAVPVPALSALLAVPAALRLIRLVPLNAPPKEEAAAMKCVSWHHWAFGLLYAFGIWIGA